MDFLLEYFVLTITCAESCIVLFVHNENDKDRDRDDRSCDWD